jgi:hypothetical protein
MRLPRFKPVVPKRDSFKHLPTVGECLAQLSTIGDQRRRMLRNLAAARWFISACASTASSSLMSPDPAGPVGPSGPGYGVAPRSTLRSV